MGLAKCLIVVPVDFFPPGLKSSKDVEYAPEEIYGSEKYWNVGPISQTRGDLRQVGPFTRKSYLFHFVNGFRRLIFYFWFVLELLTAITAFYSR